MIDKLNDDRGSEVYSLECCNCNLIYSYLEQSTALLCNFSKVIKFKVALKMYINVKGILTVVMLDE